MERTSSKKRSLPGGMLVAEYGRQASLPTSEYFDAQEDQESRSESSAHFDAQEEQDSRSESSETPPESRARSAFKRLNRARRFAGKVVNSDRVQVLIVILIAINGIMLGIGTFDFVDENERVKDIFNAIDQVFLIIFTIELGFQLLYHGWRLFLDAWLVFDFIVIVVSWAFSTLQIVRAFRIFRALRLITRIKTMKNLVVAILGVMPRIAAISLLLLLIFYIFAVMFTALFSDVYDRGFTDWDYYGRLDLTFFTLFQIMTLDNWAEIARQTMDADTWSWIPMLAFVVITGFIVVNLVIAVICDAIAALNDDDRAKVHGNYQESDQSSDGMDDHASQTSQADVKAGGNGSDDDAVEPKLVQPPVSEQIESLQCRVEELTQIQEETRLVMSQLSACLRKKKKTQSKGQCGGD